MARIRRLLKFVGPFVFPQEEKQFAKLRKLRVRIGSPRLGVMTMIKRIVIAVVAIVVVWSVLDFIIHGLILQNSYAATPELWRPQDEIKMPLIQLSVLVTSIAFVLIYAKFISDKSVEVAVKYGLLFGLAAGISMSLGMYAVMPLPDMMPVVWFLGTLVESALGGLLVGVIVKSESPPA